jgi:hypothetical protein
LGYILGDFFTNSSGRPTRNVPGVSVVIAIFDDFDHSSTKLLDILLKT